MNHYHEHFWQIAKDFGLDKKGFICTLPEIHPSYFIMKYDRQKHKIYCPNHLVLEGVYICGFGQEELKPKLVRQRVVELIEQYKQLNIQKNLNKIKEDFE